MKSLTYIGFVGALLWITQGVYGQTSDDYRRGALALNANDFGSAERYLAQVEAQSPGSTNALALRAKALIHLNRFPDAQQCLQQYLQTHSTSPDASYLLGYVLFRENRPAESLAAYTAAARLQRPAASDFKIVGLNYILLNDVPEAIKWLQRAVSEAPDDPEAAYHLGRSYYIQNFFDKSIECFKTALRLNPHYVNAENNLGLAYEGKNDLVAAEGAYRRAIKMATDAGQEGEQPYLNLANLLNHTGRNEEALSLLEKAEQMAGKQERAAEIRGRIFLAQNRLSEAEGELRGALASDPQNGSLHYLLGRVLKGEGKAGEAEREFEQTRALLTKRSGASN